MSRLKKTPRLASTAARHAARPSSQRRLTTSTRKARNTCRPSRSSGANWSRSSRPALRKPKPKARTPLTPRRPWVLLLWKDRRTGPTGRRRPGARRLGIQEGRTRWKARMMMRMRMRRTPSLPVSLLPGSPQRLRRLPKVAEGPAMRRRAARLTRQKAARMRMVGPRRRTRAAMPAQVSQRWAGVRRLKSAQSSGPSCLRRRRKRPVCRSWLTDAAKLQRETRRKRRRLTGHRPLSRRRMGKLQTCIVVRFVARTSRAGPSCSST
mmetsp:Transcript_116594/g.341242  ORF Transcript_116594/g.341242 Transcript_116594/m.341242 type:complete len:265 (+) Transcript_116594:998-1792(+)